MADRTSHENSENAPAAFQAYDEGSIPFSRSNLINSAAGSAVVSPSAQPRLPHRPGSLFAALIEQYADAL